MNSIFMKIISVINPNSRKNFDQLFLFCARTGIKVAFMKAYYCDGEVKGSKLLGELKAVLMWTAFFL